MSSTAVTRCSSIGTFCAGPAFLKDGVARASLLAGQKLVMRNPLTKLKVTGRVGVMVKLRWFAVAGVAVLSAAPASVAYAQAPEPPHAIYCRGPLSTFRTDGGKVVKTPFKWAKEAAMKENPGAGECAWADRAPQGNEKPGDTNTIIGI